MRTSLPALLLGAVVLLSACGKEEPAVDIERPHQPWVFRSVLDSLPRMITIALHDDLWAAYHTETGALYKAWRGSVNFDGAVYTTVHGPQPSTLGDAWFVNRFQEPWLLLQDGRRSPLRVQYRGHRFERGQVRLNYELHTGDGRIIRVSERPEYLTNDAGQTGFERLFTVEGVPPGARVALQLNLASLPSRRSIETDGELEIISSEEYPIQGGTALELEGLLLLNSDAPTRLSTFFTRRPTIENPNKVVGSEEEERRPLGYRLIARNDCKTCHNTFVKTVGPSYQDIAKKYRNTEENIALLAAKVKNGGSGVWGQALMSPHPDLSDEHIHAMVSYIMSLDSLEEAQLAAMEAARGPAEDTDFLPGAKVNEADLFPGAVLKVYVYDRPVRTLAEVDTENYSPVFEGVIPTIHAEGTDFQELQDNFAIIFTGYLNIPKNNNYVFRLVSDDGSRLTIDGQVVIDHDGEHGASPKDGEVSLSAGYHPFKVEFFQSLGGKMISLQWKSFDDADSEFEIVPAGVLTHHKSEAPEGPVAIGKQSSIPGDAFPLQEVHPAFTLHQARPDDFLPKVGGMDFLSDGRLVVSTWDAIGGVYILDGVQSGDPSKMTVKKIAEGFAEPLGLKVVDDEIYVLQKQELTKLIDHDGDEVADEYYTLCNDWSVTSNFHEFAFGLAYKDGYFYATLAIAILPGGASAYPQAPDRGKVVKIAREDGRIEFVAHGLRTPNGIGIGVDGEIFVADNQGDWLPSSKILHVSPGAFFNSHAVDPEGTRDLPVKPPVVWLPQDEIGNSPSTPLALNVGPYRGQMIHGEVTHGGVKRVFVEKVNGEYQGCVFRFIQGLEAGVNRMVWGPDGALYVGGIGSTGNWQQYGKQWYGLQRLEYNGTPVFEMLAVRARSNGMEIEFTEPLPEGTGWNPAEYTVRQWWYKPTAEYGGPKMDNEALRVRSANVSEDRKRVFLELEGLKPGHVVYIRIPSHWTSAQGRELWSTEAWYTLNHIPENNPGFTATPPAPLPPNTLSAEEKAQGWRLLFDGKTTKGWRNYRKETIGSSWKVEDGALTLAVTRKADGGWQAEDGGDIITEEEFQDFELRLEWKIAPCGNSGIIYNVVEDPAYEYVWQTGPEMQILDNSCHPDAKIETHRAGDLYDLIACKYEAVRPAGQWNQVRIISKDGHVEHWLNGRKLVEFQMFTDEWRERIANSKFKDMPGFGKSPKGHIALQDHGDRVWFRNIKIREL
ncbi:MAG: DUF1080 domain-containing protein [Bacteroidetes bacterium]|nr:MAG: DUF1080 domain-containing protein [Bacteroidota bacterium]